MRKREERLNLRLSTEELQILRTACELTNISASQMFRETCIKSCKTIIDAYKDKSHPYVSALSATAESQVNYFSTALRLKDSARERGVGDDTNVSEGKT